MEKYRSVGSLVLVLCAAANALPDARAQSRKTAFIESRTSECRLMPDGLPGVTADANGKEWCLYRRTEDGVSSLTVSRPPKAVAVIDGAGRGILLPSIDGTTLHVVWEQADAEGRRSLWHRLVDASAEQWLAEGEPIAATDVEALSGAAVLPDGGLCVVWHSLRRGAEPESRRRGAVMRLRGAAGAAWEPPLLASADLEITRAAVGAGERHLVFVFADPGHRLFLRAWSLADKRFEEPMPVLAAAGTPLVMASARGFSFAVSGRNLFLGFTAPTNPPEAWLAMAPLHQFVGLPPAAATPAWAVHNLGPAAAMADPGLERPFAIAPVGGGFALLLSTDPGQGHSKVNYLVCRPTGQPIARGELAGKTELIEQVAPGRGADGGLVVALGTRKTERSVMQGEIARLDYAAFQGHVSAFAGRAGGSSRRAWAQAIQQTLEWLRTHQDQDGRWDADAFMKHDQAGEPCDGAGAPQYDVGVTGLAVLCFLADGGRVDEGPHQQVLQQALRWLIGQQEENGLIGGNFHTLFIYCHAIATLALCEAEAVSAVHWLRRPAQAAINYLESHRNPYSVWRYQPRDNDNDSSVTSWCVQAYWTAREAGLEVNDQALQLAATWFDQVATPDGKHGYTKQGEGSARLPGDHAARFPVEKGEAITSIGLLCRLLLGQNTQEKPILRAAADRIAKRPPQWDPKGGAIDHYYWFFATQGLALVGGRHWSDWSKKLERAVIPHQRTDDNFRGSWDPIGAWGEEGGRIYSTAILCLALQAPHRLALGNGNR